MSSNYLDLLTLKSLYGPIKENPHEKKAKLVGQVMGESGLAKPALAYVMGRELSSAQDWDVQREGESKAALEGASELAQQEAVSVKEKRRFDSAKEVFEVFEKLSTNGRSAEAAEWLNANRDVTRLPRVESVNPTPVMTQVKFENGGWWGVDKHSQKIMVFEPAGGEAGDKANPQGQWRVATQDDLSSLSKYEQGPPKRSEVQRGNTKVTEEWDPKEKKWKEIGSGPAWKPGEEGTTTDFKNWLLMGGEKSGKSFAEYMADKLDPTGVKTVIKGKLDKKDKGKPPAANTKSKPTITPEEAKKELKRRGLI